MRMLKFILYKEFLQIFRNKMMLPILFVMPIIQLLILANAATFELTSIPVYLVDQDRSGVSQRVVQGFQSSEFFEVRGMSGVTEQGLSAMDRDEVKVVVVLGAGLERDLGRQGVAGVQVLIDAVDGFSAGVAQGYVFEILGGVSGEWGIAGSGEQFSAQSTVYSSQSMAHEGQEGQFFANEESALREPQANTHLGEAVLSGGKATTLRNEVTLSANEVSTFSGAATTSARVASPYGSATTTTGGITTPSARVASQYGSVTTTTVGVATPSAREASQYWYNPDLEYIPFMVPGILVVLVSMIGGFLSGMNVVREREIGTMEQLNVTPITRGSFIAGKLLPFWVIALVELGFGLLVARLVFDLASVGSLWLIFGSAAVFMVVILGLGLFVSTISDTQQQAMFITWFIMVLFILMGGLFTPIDSMPEWAQQTAWLNPMAWYIDLMRRVMLTGAGLEHVWKSILVLAGMGVVVLGLAVNRIRKIG